MRLPVSRPIVAAAAAVLLAAGCTSPSGEEPGKAVGEPAGKTPVPVEVTEPVDVRFVERLCGAWLAGQQAQRDLDEEQIVDGLPDGPANAAVAVEHTWVLTSQVAREFAEDLAAGVLDDAETQLVERVTAVADALSAARGDELALAAVVAADPGLATDLYGPLSAPVLAEQLDADDTCVAAGLGVRGLETDG